MMRIVQKWTSKRNRVLTCLGRPMDRSGSPANSMLDILLITRGAGSGKTSTAERWAASRAGLAAHLSHDAVHNFVKSGVISPAAGPNAEAERQWRIAIDVCVAACRVY